MSTQRLSDAEIKRLREQERARRPLWTGEDARNTWNRFTNWLAPPPARSADPVLRQQVKDAVWTGQFTPQEIEVERRRLRNIKNAEQLVNNGQVTRVPGGGYVPNPGYNPQRDYPSGGGGGGGSRPVTQSSVPVRTSTPRDVRSTAANQSASNPAVSGYTPDPNYKPLWAMDPSQLVAQGYATRVSGPAMQPTNRPPVDLASATPEVYGDFKFGDARFVEPSTAPTDGNPYSAIPAENGGTWQSGVTPQGGGITFPRPGEGATAVQPPGTERGSDGNYYKIDPMLAFRRKQMQAGIVGSGADYYVTTQNGSLRKLSPEERGAYKINGQLPSDYQARPYSLGSNGGSTGGGEIARPPEPTPQNTMRDPNMQPTAPAVPPNWKPGPSPAPVQLFADRPPEPTAATIASNTGIEPTAPPVPPSFRGPAAAPNTAANVVPSPTAQPTAPPIPQTTPQAQNLEEEAGGYLGLFNQENLRMLQERRAAFGGFK